jgi:ClpP class serine protease
MQYVTTIIWLFFIFSFLMPFFRQKQIEADRVTTIRSIEKERGSRLITLIHRQEALSFMGIPLRRYITLEDSERLLRAIRFTPDDMPIDLVLHTPGGLVLASEQIARALKRHPGKVTVMVPHYAMSGGTLICLAADAILLDENAMLGPIDPQIGQLPASSILRVLKDKPIAEVDDQTIMFADIAEKAVRQIEDTAAELLDDKLEPEKAREIARHLSKGQWTHDFALVCSDIGEMGLPVACRIPDSIYRLMDLYPQPSRAPASVEFIPTPYRRGREKE